MSIHCHNLGCFNKVLSVMKTVPNLEEVLIYFTNDGIRLFAKPVDTPVVTDAFIYKKNFISIECKNCRYVCVNFKRLSEVVTKIDKTSNGKSEVSLKYISNDAQLPGLYFSIHNDGCECTSVVNEIVSTSNLIDFDIVKYGLCYKISSKVFNDSVGVLSEDVKYVSFQSEDEKLNLKGVTDMGIVTENIVLKLGKVSTQLECVLFRKYLKCVVCLSKIFNSITIQLKPCESSSHYYPVLFSHSNINQPELKVNIFIMPCEDVC